jgi:hypothetical protein
MWWSLAWELTGVRRNNDIRVGDREEERGRAHGGPEQALAHAVALARGAGELEGGVHHVGVQAQPLVHALREEGVPAAELGHGQDAHFQPPVVATVHPK